MNEQQIEYTNFMKKLVKNLCEVQNEYNKLSPSVKDAVNLDMRILLVFVESPRQLSI